MKLSIVGIWRDSEPHIRVTLKNLENLYDICNPDFYFYENDSVDNTKNILQNWILDKKGELISESLGYKKYKSVVDIERFKLLAIYRNKIKKIVESQSTSEYTLIIDTDVSFDNNDILNLLTAFNSNNDICMAVSNTRQNISDLMLQQSKDSFYDVLPIRDSYNNSGLYFTDCPLLMSEDRKKWADNENVSINAGFSGVSIIKTEILPKCRWSTTGYSEHINFCSEVKRHGDILIVPKSRPKVNLDTKSLPISDFQKSANHQKQILSYLNNTYSESVFI